MARSISIYTFVHRFSLVNPLWVLFLTSRGMSLAEIGAVEAAFHVGRLVHELPSGLLADRSGRRVSLALSDWLLLPGLALSFLGSSVWAVALGMLIAGAADSFHSGAHEALIYDHLASQRRAASHARMYGRQIALGLLAGSCASALAGWMADRSFALVFATQAAVSALAGVLASRLAEPRSAREPREPTPAWSELGRWLRRDRTLLQLLVLWGAWDFLSLTLHSFSTRTLFERLGSNTGVGAVLAVGTLLGVVGAAHAHRLGTGHDRPRRAAIAMAIMGAAALAFALGPLALGLVCLWLHTLLDWTLMPVFSQLVNERVPSHLRATILSLSGLAFSALMLPGFPAVGALADRSGLPALFAGVGAIQLLAGGGFLILARSLARPPRAAPESA